MITIFIKGIILFVAATVYDSGADKMKTGAAIAVHGTEGAGSYGVMLPKHQTQLILVAGEVETPEGQLPPPFKKDGTEYVADLNGYRIQIGDYTNNTCGAVIVAGATSNLTGVPELSTLGLPTTEIATKARPQGSDYKNIDPALVAAWLDIKAGDLTTEGGTSMMAEFRPATTVTYNPIQQVKWTVSNLAKPCLIVTPFNGADGTVVFSSSAPVVRFENLPDSGSTHHGRAFASYDFELLYKVLKEQPPIPPIPHQMFLDAHVNEADFLRHCVLSCSVASKPTGDPVSGMNCGPGNNRYP